MNFLLAFWSFLQKPNVILSTKIGALSICNILISFSYQWYIIIYFGASSNTDALFAGMVVPQLILAITSGSLTFVLVPLLTDKDKEQYRRDTWTFFQGIGIIFFSFSFFFFVSASYWVPFLVPGFEDPTVLLTIDLVRIQLLSMIFIALSSVLWAANHANNHFLGVEVASITANLIGFVFLMWGVKNFGIVTAAWAMVIKSVFQVLFLFPSLGHYSKPDFRSDTIKKAWKRIRPLLIGTSYYKTDRLLDRYLASMTFSGGLSLLYLGQQLYTAGSTILNKAIVSPMIPELTKRVKVGDWRNFRNIIHRRVILMLSITLTTSIGVILVGEPVLQLIFGHNQFDNNDIEALRWILLALSGMWIGGAIGQVLSSSFYASGETKIPTKIGSFGFTLGIIFKVAGFFLGGVMGIAIGTSLYYALNIVLLYMFLERYVKNNNKNKYNGQHT